MIKSPAGTIPDRAVLGASAKAAAVPANLVVDNLTKLRQVVPRGLGGSSANIVKKSRLTVASRVKC